MWIIAIILFQGPVFKIASDQMIYQDKQFCEVARLEMLARLEATRPPEGIAVTKCINMATGTAT